MIIHSATSRLGRAINILDFFNHRPIGSFIEFHMNGLGFLENDIGVAEMSGMLFSKIKIIEPLTIETFRPSYLSMVV